MEEKKALFEEELNEVSGGAEIVQSNWQVGNTYVSRSGDKYVIISVIDKRNNFRYRVTRNGENYPGLLTKEQLLKLLMK